MARHASTYRQARREAWKLTDLSWVEVNGALKRGQNKRLGYASFGPVRADYIGGIDALKGQSKYMPHIGAKQRAKGAV